MVHVLLSWYRRYLPRPFVLSSAFCSLCQLNNTLFSSYLPFFYFFLFSLTTKLSIRKNTYTIREMTMENHLLVTCFLYCKLNDFIACSLIHWSMNSFLSFSSSMHFLINHSAFHEKVHSWIQLSIGFLLRLPLHSFTNPYIHSFILSYLLSFGH